MNNLNTPASSGERLSFYKLFSVKNYIVEIPIIQRDYAQGRASEQEVRASFLDALKQYLIQNLPNRDLDFVYGSLSKDGDSLRFVPLDGQQRLTTLFLLHWYLAQIANQADVLRATLYHNEKSLFRYETRPSSSEFCDALMGNDIDMSALLKSGVDENDSLSKTIQDRGWFHLTWNNDPTIQSMLTMLDSIHAKFSGHPEFFLQLIDEENPIISFFFLDLKEFNLSDDLYIKMNARGKPLTDFENFKAKFEQFIDSVKSELPRYTLDLGIKNDVDGHQYFVHKIDMDWADLFWSYRSKSAKDETFDDELMNFIRLNIANHCLIENNDSNIQGIRLKKLFGNAGKLNHLSFIDYEDLQCFTPSFVAYLINILDILYHDGAVEDGIKPYLDQNDYYSEEDYFKKVIANNTNYPEKLHFYAFYHYLLSRKEKAGLIEWMRVINNLIENTIINDSFDYLSCLQSINILIRKDESILKVLRENCDVVAFHPAQVLEEKIKAHLIAKSDKWKEYIIQVEKHLFFKGQIGFALNFSGILDFYRQFQNCAWDISEEQQYFSNFKAYAEKGCHLFDLIKDSSSKIEYLWERAVLSKGMYFTSATYNRWNMLSTRVSRNNIERDHSWKKLLRISAGHDDGWEQRQSYVKAVFDDANFDSNQIVNSLQNICNKSLSDANMEAWKKAFIKYKELFRDCKQGFIFKNEEMILLLNESQRNHYHSELNSKVFYLEFQSESEHFFPFGKLKYSDVKSSEDQSSAYLGPWDYKKKKYYVEVQFFDGDYLLNFYCEGLKKCAEALAEIIIMNKFELEQDKNSYIYRWSAKTSKAVLKKIKDLCSDLREHVSE